MVLITPWLIGRRFWYIFHGLNLKVLVRLPMCMEADLTFSKLDLLYRRVIIDMI